jgi:ABC-type sugar transport system substrate-binding protein
MTEKTFGDISEPNAGRVYDYLLGGHNNYEIDRQAAEYMLSLLPSTRKWVRMLRLFLQESATILYKKGFDKFLDLGSGLPTSSHIHSNAPQATVIYVDADPTTAAYGQELLKEHPDATYIVQDISDIDAVLNSPVIQERFGDERKVAIGLNAVLSFFNDDQIRQITQKLYDWAAPGSKLFATFETKDPALTTPNLEQFLAMFDQMGASYYFTTLEEAKEVMKPWTPDERGFLPLYTWLDLEDQFSAEDQEDIGLQFYGAIFEKK